MVLQILLDLCIGRSSKEALSDFMKSKYQNIGEAKAAFGFADLKAALSFFNDLQVQLYAA